jgi:hypothetical protein
MTTTLYTPGYVFRTMCAVPEGLGISLGDLERLTYEALGYARAVHDVSQRHALGYAVGGTDGIYAFVAAWRAHIVSGGSRYSIEGAYDRWLQYGFIGAEDAIKRQSVIVDGKTRSGYIGGDPETWGVVSYTTLDGLVHQARDVTLFDGTANEPAVSGGRA